jgi:hypothetical protein
MSLQTSLQPPDNAHYDAVGSLMPNERRTALEIMSETSTPQKDTSGQS